MPHDLISFDDATRRCPLAGRPLSGPKIATSCRCAQEVREIGYDLES